MDERAVEERSKSRSKSRGSMEEAEFQTPETKDQISKTPLKISNKKEELLLATPTKALKLKKELLPQSLVNLIEDIEKSSPTCKISSLLDRVRENSNEPMALAMEKKRAKFKHEYQDLWKEVEKYVLLSLLYHTFNLNLLNSQPLTSELLLPRSSSTPAQAIPPSISATDPPQKTPLMSIGKSLNSVLSWMVNRLQGEREYQQLLENIILQCKDYYAAFKVKRAVVLKEKREQEEIKKQEMLVEEEQKSHEMEKEREKEKEKEDKIKAEESLKAIVAEEAKAKKGKAGKSGKLNEGKNVKRKKKKIVSRMYHEVKKTGRKGRGKSRGLSEKSRDSSTSFALSEKKDEEEKSIKQTEEESNKLIQQQQQEEDKEKENEILIETLSPLEQEDFKLKLHHELYDAFLEKYQGNFSLVKNFCSVLDIPYEGHDPSEALKHIFKKCKEKLKSIIDFEEKAELTENLPIDDLKLESPYAIVARHVRERSLLLVQVDVRKEENKMEEEEEKKGMKVQRSLTKKDSFKGTGESFPEDYGLTRSVSLQPFVNDARNNEELQKGVENYMKWKREKKTVEAQEDASSPESSNIKAVVSFLTGNWVPQKMQTVSKLHQKRAAYRSLGLKYQIQFFNLFQNTQFQRFFNGNLTESFITHSLNNIETCGFQLCKVIMEQSKTISDKLMKFLIHDYNLFKKMRHFVKKILKNNNSSSNAKRIHDGEHFVYTHMKQMLVIFSDIKVVLQESNISLILHLDQLARKEKSAINESVLITKKFLASIVSLTLLSQNIAGEFQTSTLDFAKLHSYLANCSQVILNKFLSNVSSSRPTEAKFVISQLMLELFVDALEKECGLTDIKPNSQEKINFNEPNFIQRISFLLSFIDELLIQFDDVKQIKHEMRLKTAKIFGFVLLKMQAPSVLMIASKCAQLIFQSIESERISVPGIFQMKILNLKSPKKRII